jgi:diadenosine tetraphosphatase ApaH/serine/threonine PP2A family protein phosphatase
MLRRYQSSLLINPGSVGLPFDRYPTDAATRNPAWAEYAVVEADGPRLNLELHRVPYDLDALKRAIRASGMPHAEEWLADWVAQ